MTDFTFQVPIVFVLHSSQEPLKTQTDDVEDRLAERPTCRTYCLAGNESVQCSLRTSPMPPVSEIETISNSSPLINTMYTLRPGSASTLCYTYLPIPLKCSWHQYELIHHELLSCKSPVLVIKLYPFLRALSTLLPPTASQPS